MAIVTPNSSLSSCVYGYNSGSDFHLSDRNTVNSYRLLINIFADLDVIIW